MSTNAADADPIKNVDAADLNMYYLILDYDQFNQGRLLGRWWKYLLY